MVGYASTVTPRRLLIALICTQTALLGAWLAWRWQPERAVEMRFEAFCKAISDRKPSKLEKLIDPAYADRWGMDRTTALREGREILRHFFALTLTPHDITVTPAPAPREWVVRARLRLSGTGSPIASLAEGEVNRLEAPWEFTWRRTDWRPWNWRLTRLDHPGIDLSRRHSAWGLD